MNNLFMDLDFNEFYLDEEIEDDEDEDLKLDSCYGLDKHGEGHWTELSYYRYNQRTLDN